jgi:hypothetical protein
MKFRGINRSPNSACKLFRCPIIAGTRKEKAKLPKQCPINNERFTQGKCFGCTAYIDITDDCRKQVPHESKRYKDICKRRTEVERYFSRLGPREIEEVSHYKYRSIRNHMTLAHLSLSLTALASALILKRPDKIRCYKTYADVA